MKKTRVEEVPEDHNEDTRENVFQSFRTKFSSSFFVISLAKKTSYCLSTKHNPEFPCVICTGIALFALLLHFFALHYVYY